MLMALQIVVKAMQLGAGTWIFLMFLSLAMLWRRPDTQVELWSYASAWAPWKTAAKAIQWYRQRTGRRQLDRIVDFHRDRRG